MADVQILTWSELSASDRHRLLQRAQSNIDAAIEVVAPIVEDIRQSGVEALCRWVHKLDSPDLDSVTERDLVVSESEMEMAEAAVDAYGAGPGGGLPLREAISVAVGNVISYHAAQPRDEDWEIEVQPGVRTGERVTPIGSVGIYVPRGKGSFPSVTYMLAVPAYIAGVPEIAICTPPDRNGVADPACLFTAGLVAERFGRVPTVYKVGGSQAIAALALGAGPLPRVAKVLGPGNEYVTAAKRLLAGVLDAGLPAGPSESIVVCDSGTDPVVAAHELLVEAEHGPNSSAVLLTHDRVFGERVAALAGELVDALPDPQRTFCRTGFTTYGGVIVTSSLAESLDVANEFAAEHVHVLTANPRRDSASIRDAGELLLGEHASIPFGNFCIGLNAVLPTGGFARAFSGVGVNSFLKRTSIAEVSALGATNLAPVAEALALYEGFPAHRAAAASARERATLEVRSESVRSVP